MPNRPLDRLRNTKYWFVRDFFLLFFAIVLGAQSNGCLYEEEGLLCPFDRVIRFGGLLAYETCFHIASILWMTLALVSPHFQKFLGSKPLQFLGRISFSFYLIHYLFIKGPQIPLYKSLAPKIGYGWAVFVAYIVITPVIIGVSYLLTIWVDEPCKNYVYEIDMDNRITDKKQPKLSFKEKVKKHKISVIYAWYLSVVFIVSLFGVER